MNCRSSKEIRRFNYLLGETEAVYHEIALKLGLSDSAMKILYTVCDNGGNCPLQRVCLQSGLSKQTVNSALRKLEQACLIRLEPAGFRKKNVCLTDEGFSLAQKTALRVIHMENSILASWPYEDVETYLRLTEKFLADLKQKSAELFGKDGEATDEKHSAV